MNYNNYSVVICTQFVFEECLSKYRSPSEDLKQIGQYLHVTLTISSRETTHTVGVINMILC